MHVSLADMHQLGLFKMEQVCEGMRIVRSERSGTGLSSNGCVSEQPGSARLDTVLLVDRTNTGPRPDAFHSALPGLHEQGVYGAGVTAKLKDNNAVVVSRR